MRLAYGRNCLYNCAPPIIKISLLGNSFSSKCIILLIGLFKTNCAPGKLDGWWEESTTLNLFGNGFFGNTAIASAGTNASNLGLFEYDVPADYKAICSKGLNT